MNCFVIKVAELNVLINTRFDRLFAICKDYVVDTDDYDISVSVSDADIMRERDISEGEFSDAYLESVCMYRNLCLQLPKYGAFLLHASCIEVDGVAYAFSAASGTGKSTHTMLWRRLLGDRMRYVNGDKPIIRFFDGLPYACGTPWAGKEGYQNNCMVPVRSICFIERGTENKIINIGKDAGKLIMKQIILPSDAEGVICTLDLVDRFLSSVSSYRLECNISLEAARIAYEAMSTLN